MVDFCFADGLTPPLRSLRDAPQQPDWGDPASLELVRGQLIDRPGLVDWAECQALRCALADVVTQSGQVLHAGDCAERFVDSRPEVLARKVNQLDELAGLMRVSADQPVVRIGRLAGQYGKPRSRAWEELPDGRLLPAYRGDAVNDPALDESARQADPERLLRAYDASCRSLQQLRRSWAGRSIADRVYASHEGLLLDYELPMVRSHPQPYASSAHLLWVGDRTRQLDGPHVALLASIDNPVAVKVGPRADPAEVAELCVVLNPERIPGRLTLVFRLGARQVGRLLPPMVTAIRSTGIPVLWLCDPMHGNTIRTRSGRKTRTVESIQHEIAVFVEVLHAHRLQPHGLHLEITPDEVTECCGGPAMCSTDVRLPHFRSACDPRLNASQARQVVATYAAAVEGGIDTTRGVARCAR